MRSEIREIITDIKAATRIGLEDSLWLSLDSLLDLPQISGNPRMEEVFIRQVILPIGEMLAESNLRIDQLHPIGKTSHAAFRAICAVALTIRFINRNEGKVQELDAFGQDPRPDVGLSLAMTAKKHSGGNLIKLNELVTHFLKSKSSRTLSVAIRLLPAIAEYNSIMAFDYIQRIPYQTEPEIRLAISETLTEMALAGHGNRVLEYMKELVSQKEDNLWIITKSLSTSWASKYSIKSLEVLKSLIITYQFNKLIHNTLQALIRHGAGAEVKKQLSIWKNEPNENLRLAAEQFFTKEA